MTLSSDQLALLIPIIAIVLGIGVAFWAIYWGHRTKQLEFEERRAMIEKGMMPPAVLSEDARHMRPTTLEDHLRGGIIMTFLGGGFFIGAYLLLHPVFRGDGPPPWTLGFVGAIVGMIGLAKLLIYFLRKDHVQEEQRNRDSSR